MPGIARAPRRTAPSWPTHLEYDWDSATWRHWLRALTSRFRLLRYDPRGCGLSEWDTPIRDVPTWSADLGTVVDADGFLAATAA